MTIRAGGASLALGSGLGSGINIAFPTRASFTSLPLLSFLGNSAGLAIVFFVIGIGLGAATGWAEFACPAPLDRKGSGKPMPL